MNHPETITPTLCSWKNLSSVNVVLDCQMGWEPLVYRGVSSLMIITKKKKTSKKADFSKHTGYYRMLVGVFLYLPICMSSCVCSVVSDSLQCRELQPARLLCSWDSLGKNTGVGCHALLQGIFLTQGMNTCLLGLLHCRQILFCLSHGEAHLYCPRLLFSPCLKFILYVFYIFSFLF